MKQTGFPEYVTIIQNGNLILKYLLELLISFATQKRIFLLPEQIHNFKIVSWSYQPEAKAVDAFLTDWGKQFSYIFLPFSLLGKVTSKIWQNKAHCIVIIPKWTTQYWYTVIMEIAISDIQIKPAPNNLLLPQNKNKLHPLHPLHPFTSDPSNSINTVEIVSSNDILQAALRPSTIRKYNIKQNGTITACKIIYHTYSLK